MNESDYHPDVHVLYVGPGVKPMNRHVRARLDRKARDRAPIKPTEDDDMVPTLKVVDADHAQGFVIVNRKDFDPRVHTLHESETAKPPTPEEVATNLAGDHGNLDKYGNPRTAFESIEDRASGRAHRSSNQKAFEERKAEILNDLSE